MFNNLFYYEENIMTNTAFKFFYFRTSPRGNTKFGVMDIPWQRLRMQQQGTDEEIQFDHIWLVRSSDGSWAFDFIERKLKDRYKKYCLAESNKRAGHTEWFSKVNIRDFQKKFKEFCKEHDVELKKVKLKEGYKATKKSQCPLRAPATYELTWYDEFWSKIPQ